LHLTPEQVAAARALGCSFQPATQADIARLTVQRRVFHIDGEPVLATRDGFLETAGTLAVLIAEGLIRQRDLAAGQATGEGRGVPDAAPPASPDPTPVPAPPATPEPPAPPLAPAPMPPHPEGGADGSLSPRTLAAGRSPRPRQPRWLTAGATRRGRDGVHWSTRQR
jgi:hypothetical protein